MPLPARGELRITGLVVSYGANTGVTAAIPAGSVVGLIGPNGSGKSTLLKAVAGVARPGSGSITLGGAPIEHRGAEVAFVPQREEVNWDFPVTARDVVLMGRYRAVGWLRRP